MAECVVARCVQERRFLKRELQKWGKNVLYLVGLERVAQEIMGVDRWTKLSQPQLELETKELVDWNPDDKCYFCNNWKSSPLDSLNGESSLIEDYLSDQEHGTFSRSISPTSINSDQPLDLSIGNRTRSLSPNGLLNGELNGSSVAALLKVPHIPDKSGKLKRPVRIESAVCKRSYTEDELQAALHDIQSGKLGTRRAAVIYGIPRSTLRNKVYKLALIGEKASLQDSSKINKVETTNKSSKSQTLLLNEDHNFETKHTDKSTLASESLRRLLRNRISENLENHHLQQTLYDTSNSSMFASLESNPALAPILSHVLANVHQLALMSLQGSVQLDDDLKDESGNLNLPLLPDLIRKLTEKRLEEECDRLRSPPASHTASQPSKVDSSETAAVILKIPSYKPVKTVHNSDANSALVSSSQLSNNSASNSVNNEASSNGSKIYGATLKEIIAKNITQRVNKNKQTISSSVSGTSVATSNGSSAGVKKARAAEAVNSGAAGPSGSGHSLRSTRSSSSTSSSIRADSNKDSKHEKRDKPEKRSRPKRGRYRNYDRDNLVEAVRAVQRGEMSVHRAGSFYGVPHSTLEYKVKERHLLRQRKHRSNLAKMGKSAHASSGKTASSTSSSCSNSSCSTSSTVSSMKTAAKNNNTKSTAAVGEKKGKGKELQVGGENVTTSGENPSGTNDDNRWSNSPLFALDFSRLNSSNFFASQMMRKLQEDALTQGSRNAATAASDTLSNRDALLLGVLLRNGLQMTESNGTSK